MVKDDQKGEIMEPYDYLEIQRLYYYIPKVWAFTGRIKYEKITDFYGNFKYCHIFLEITYEEYTESILESIKQGYRLGFERFLYPQITVKEWINIDDFCFKDICEETITNCK